MKPELPFERENFEREITEIDFMDSGLKFEFFLVQLRHSILNDRIFESKDSGLLFHEGKRCWLIMKLIEKFETAATWPIWFTWNLNGYPFQLEGLFALPHPDDQMIHRPIKEVYGVSPQEIWDHSKFEPFYWSEEIDNSEGVKH